MRKIFDLSVYFVADPSVCGGRDIAEIVMQAVQGGVSMVQYRNKGGDMATIHADCAILSELLSAQSIPFLVNDHVDVAFAVGADGVHVGQGDMHPKEARERLGDNAIIGQTAFTEDHIKAIDPGIVDYIGTGPFYETKTDKGKPVLGAERFAKLVKLSPVPAVGIGGITPDNTHEVIAAGANGVAMMRSISEADSPEEAARAIKESIKA